MVELLDDAVIDWTECPWVEINPRKLSGTPILRGTRMPAYGIVENSVSGLSPEEIADLFEIPEEGVLALLRFAAERNPDIKL